MISQRVNSTSLARYTHNSHLTPANIFQAHIMLYYPNPPCQIQTGVPYVEQRVPVTSWIKMTITSHSQEKQISNNPLRKFQRIPLSSSRLKNKRAFPTRC